MIVEHTDFTHVDPLQPEDLDLLQRVFDATCAEAGIEKKSRQAEGLAATLLKLSRAAFVMNKNSKRRWRKSISSDVTILVKPFLPHGKSTLSHRKHGCRDIAE